MNIPRRLSIAGAAALLHASFAAAAPTIVSLTFDMGTGDQLLARQILEAHGFRGTFYVNSGTIGQSGFYLSVSDLQSMQAAGHQIAGQTVDHIDLTTLTPAQQQHQVCDDRTTIQGWGLNVVDFNYPYGNYNASAVATVQGCGYRSSRTLYGIGTTPFGADCGAGCVPAESIPPANLYAIRTPILFDNTAVPADFEAVVLNAEQSGGGWVPFVMHRICDGCASNSITVATLTAFADWLAARASLGTVVETVGQVLDGIPPPPAPAPSISAILPASAMAGSGDLTLTISGANFINTSTVRWNGAARQTTYLSNTKLSVVILASDLAASGVAQVTAFNPAPGGGSSSALTFAVGPRIPSISNMSPASAMAGSSDLTLTIKGINFTASSTVLWSGAPQQTVVVSSTQLTAVISASELAAPATAQITVMNPGTGGGTSFAATFAVEARVGAADPGGIRIFPNPWRADHHQGIAVTIDGLGAGSEVRLFTLSGRWVRTLDEGGGKALWDLTDASGRRVASGVYLYLITGAGLREHGTLAVVE